MAELLVHADVDHWVVDGGTLGKEGWEGHEEWSELRALMCKYIPGHTCIGQPTYMEEDNHDHNHAGDFLLSPLGGLRLLLGGSSLLDSTEQPSIAEEHNAEWNQEVAGEHVDNEGLIVETLCSCVVVNSTRALHAFRDVTRPANKRGHGAGAGHYPGAHQKHDCVILSKAEVGDGLADN